MFSFFLFSFVFLNLVFGESVDGRGQGRLNASCTFDMECGCLISYISCRISKISSHQALPDYHSNKDKHAHVVWCSVLLTIPSHQSQLTLTYPYLVRIKFFSSFLFYV